MVEGAAEVFLGIAWPAWGRMPAASWLALFASASWISHAVGLGRRYDGESLAVGHASSFAHRGGQTGFRVPRRCSMPWNRGSGCLTLPEAAALASLTLSGVGGDRWLCDRRQLAVGRRRGNWSVAGILIGIVAFPADLRAGSFRWRSRSFAALSCGRGSARAGACRGRLSSS